MKLRGRGTRAPLRSLLQTPRLVPHGGLILSCHALEQCLQPVILCLGPTFRLLHICDYNRLAVDVEKMAARFLVASTCTRRGEPGAQATIYAHRITHPTYAHTYSYTQARVQMAPNISALWRKPACNPANGKARTLPLLRCTSQYACVSPRRPQAVGRSLRFHRGQGPEFLSRKGNAHADLGHQKRHTGYRRGGSAWLSGRSMPYRRYVCLALLQSVSGTMRGYYISLRRGKLLTASAGTTNTRHSHRHDSPGPRPRWRAGGQLKHCIAHGDAGSPADGGATV
jgi:hypothetical protein